MIKTVECKGYASEDLIKLLIDVGVVTVDGTGVKDTCENGNYFVDFGTRTAKRIDG